MLGPRLPGLVIPERDAREERVALDADDAREIADLDLAVLFELLSHDRLGAQVVLADDYGHLGREAREEQSLLARGVAAADHEDALSAIEHSIARGAVGNAMAGVCVLVGETGMSWRCSTGDDDGPCVICCGICRDGEDA